MMASATAQGDISRSGWPGTAWSNVALYLGSGRSGALFDGWGLMNRAPGELPAEQLQGRSNGLMHADHWCRGAYGLDYHLPVARLMWQQEPCAPREYTQHWSAYDGLLETRMAWSDVALRSRCWFDPERRDVLAVLWEHEGSVEHLPDLLLAPVTQGRTHYSQTFAGSFAADDTCGGFRGWACRLRVGNADSVIALRMLTESGRIHGAPCDEGYRIRFEGYEGRHLLLLGVRSHERRHLLRNELKTVSSADLHLEESKHAWHRRWGSACIRLPDPGLQALWVRSAAYMLASFEPDVRAPAPPMGWSGGGRPFHLPQDVSCIVPALLRLGHLDLARAVVGFYRERLEDAQRFTRRVFGAQGTMWFWECPIGPDARPFQDGVPNAFQYEIHNAAYPARMARDTARMTGDRQWTRRVAWPVIRESARFYASVLQHAPDGLWELAVHPSMGQDEHGEANAHNYLCALFSARYCLLAGLEVGRGFEDLDMEFSLWQRILNDGLAFPRLLEPGTGVYATCEEQVGHALEGHQKHPVQLNPLVFLPTGSEADRPTTRAYELRHRLCGTTAGNTYSGWTPAAFWLAAAHMRDGVGLRSDLERLLPCRYVDRDMVQIYESSESYGMPFYLTSHGLYLQAVQDMLVTDHGGRREERTAIPPGWEEAQASGLVTSAPEPAPSRSILRKL